MGTLDAEGRSQGHGLREGSREAMRMGGDSSPAVSGAVLCSCPQRSS